MAIRWTKKALADLQRLHGFLAPGDPAAALRAVRKIIAGVRQLAAHPRLGPRLPQFKSREVRKLIIGDCELRYEVADTDLNLLRLWHVREDR